MAAIISIAEGCRSLVALDANLCVLLSDVAAMRYENKVKFNPILNAVMFVFASLSTVQSILFCSIAFNSSNLTELDMGYAEKLTDRGIGTKTA